MRKAHIHRYIPLTAYSRPGQCSVEGCPARGNDGQLTGLGQILQHGSWVDYARDTEPKALAWAAGHDDRRAVDWITREELS